MTWVELIDRHAGDLVPVIACAVILVPTVIAYALLALVVSRR